MQNKIQILALMGVFFFNVYAQNSDRLIIELILKENDITWEIQKRITMEGDRIVALNLNGDIGDNWLKVLSPDIGKLSELRTLTLNDNDLIELPSELYNCTKLVTLEVKNNNLRELPEGISKLSSLKELDIRNNELNELPSDLGMLKSVYKMQLWGNKLTTLPVYFGSLSTLKELYLMNNRLSFLPESIAKLNLNYLDISFNYLTENTENIDKWLKKFNKNYKNEQFDKTEGKFFL